MNQEPLFISYSNYDIIHPMEILKDFFVGKVEGSREPVYSFDLRGEEYSVVKEPIRFHGRHRTRLAIYDSDIALSDQNDDNRLASMVGDWIEIEKSIIFNSLRLDNHTFSQRERHRKGLIQAAMKAALYGVNPAPIKEWQSSSNRVPKGGDKLYIALGMDPNLISEDHLGFSGLRHTLRRNQ